MNASRPEPPVRLAGAPNFRDAGGLPCGGGRRLRSGLLYRSGDLSRLGDADLAMLRSLGIGAVIDLRSAWERGDRVNRWPEAGHAADAAVDLWQHDVSSAPGSDPRRLRDLLLASPGVAGAREMMIESYRQMAMQCAPTVAALLRLIAADPRPALVHCTSGKDRTGVVCAFIQSAAGVPREQVYAHYLRSLDLIDREGMRGPLAALMREKMGLDLDTDAIDTINSVAAEFLDAAFVALESQFESLEECSAAHGLPREVFAAALDRLREY